MTQPPTVDRGVVVPREIWLVGGTVGEWSDRSDFTVGAWESEADAKAFVERIEALTRISDSLASDRWDDDASNAKWENAVERCRDLHPGWSDYCGEGPSYTAWPVTVTPSTAPAQPPAALDEAVGLLRRISSAHGACVCGSFECSVPGVGCLGDALHAEVMAARAFLANLEPSQ